jgi:RNA polymerase sigma factor (sigma-70 family)
MLHSLSMVPEGRTDAELVGDTLAGNREAFAGIVRRYQNLVCSLAYSGTGDLARSEDLAQDTFLAVWRQLPELREPEKLRAWICGIMRNRIRQSYRGENREPIFKAETLEHADEAVALEAQPSDQAVSQDETAIMWRALERIPDTYREPLILFHRENQSIERVAAAMDLTEDAVKQRLVRGRKLLQAEVASVVEGALRRTVPGPIFTLSVMEALPTATTAAKAGTMAAKAAIGATAVAKGSLGAGVAGFFAMVVTSPLAPLFILFAQRKLGRAAEAATASADERKLMERKRREFAASTLAVGAVITAFKWWLDHQSQPPWYAPLFLGIPVGIGMLLVVTRRHLAGWHLRQMWAKAGKSPVQRKWEYRSQRTLLGWPLVHIRIGFDPHWRAAAAPVRAWIAVGYVAQGIIFAGGAVAIAPISFGTLALGVVSGGACVMGVGLALGLFLGVGVFAVGTNAIGWMATGAFAIGWRAAAGLAAYARIFAEIPATHNKLAVARALHSHDAEAREFFAQSRFFTWTGSCIHLFLEHPVWFIFPFSLLVLAMFGSMVVKMRRLPSAPA